MGANLDEEYIIQLEKTLRAIKGYKKERMKSAGLNITSDQWALIKRISEVPGINQKDLANSTFKDPASVKRTLDILETEGYVERSIVQSDRREHSLRLTETGTGLIHKTLPITIDLRAKGVKGISQEEMNSFTHTLLKLQSNFE